VAQLFSLGHIRIITINKHQTIKMKLALLFIAPLFICGCVSTTYTKSISITKDANGNIVSRTETESVVQPNQNGWPVKFEYLKGIQPGETK